MSIILRKNKLSAAEGRNYQSKLMLSSIDSRTITHARTEHNLLVDINCSVVAIAEILSHSCFFVNFDVTFSLMKSFLKEM